MLLVYLVYWFVFVVLIGCGELLFAVWLCCVYNIVGLFTCFLCVCDLVLVCLIELRCNSGLLLYVSVSDYLFRLVMV